MSKAFTREDDQLDEPILLRPSALPPGVKNYITVDGERRLRSELDRMVQSERPSLVAKIGDLDAKRELRVLDQRIAELQRSLQTAVVVPPPVVPDDVVKFGATVTIRERNGAESTYRIVGVDEIDIDRGWVSWLSPIAKALVNKRAGDHLRLKLPAGDQEMEILRVAFD